MDQLPRLGKRELNCLLLFTCNYVVSVWRGFLFLWVLGMGYLILLWHSLSLPYNYIIFCVDCLRILYLLCLVVGVLSVFSAYNAKSPFHDLIKKKIRACNDLLIKLSLAGGQSLKVYKPKTRSASDLSTYDLPTAE